MYDDLLDLHERDPEDFADLLRNLLLFEPDTQLYLLDADGTVLASTGQVPLPPGFKVKLGAGAAGGGRGRRPQRRAPM